MRSERGVTLIEFMVSMAILGLVALTSFYVLTSARQMSESNRARLLALNTARSTLEQIKNTALISVPAMSTSSLIPSNLPGGAITITTNPANITATTTVATITVRVQWLGARNRTESLQISTMRSRY
jgi:prepilin-type N-terminal cleavage/methylation domain-containing protein